MHRWPVSRPRDIAWATVVPALTTGYAAMLVFAFGLPGIAPEQRELACLGGIAFGSILALVFGIMAATRRALQRATRRAWWLLSLGFVALNLIPVGLDMSGQAGNMQTGAVSWADLFRLLFIPFAVAGLLMFPRRSGTRRVRYKIAFDMVTVLGGAFMVMWYFVIGPILQEHQLSTVGLVVAVAYPAGDLVMIFGVLSVLMHEAEATVRRPLVLLVAGMCFQIANDVYLGYLKGVSDGVVVPADRWQYGSVAIAMFLFTLAGIEQCRQARAHEQAVDSRATLKRPSRLPYLALTLGYGLLLLVALQAAVFPWAGLVVGAALMTAGVAARQVLAMRENHDLVVTDSLTGLANRLELHRSLDRAFDRSQRTGQPIAVMLIDLNGFKQVNDTLGHEAGDRLLVGFAHMLKASVFGSDTVARQGGDEFAVVLGAIGTAANAQAVVTRILDGMRRPIDVGGQEIHPRASIGVALSTPGPDSTPSTLLHHADLAMYQAKSRKAAGSGWQLYTGPATEGQHPVVVTSGLSP